MKLALALHRTLLLSLALLLMLSTIPLVKPAHVSALSGAEFRSGRIIDDGVFFNRNSMTVQEIQNFLNSKVPTCDTNGTQMRGNITRAQHGTNSGYPPPYTCLKDYSENMPTKSADSYCASGVSGGQKSSAQIIYDISQACGINVKALLVTLQKEQSLITDDWPWSIQYRSAMGYGCPDTAPCDTEYYGFFNQVYNAARQFQRYAKQPNNFNFAGNRTSYVQYNPNAGCGGGNIYIESQATAGLYNYTPYQPNGAALNNLYGTGDGCSTYGNRNFWRLYRDWFGSTWGSIKILNAPGSVSWGEGRIDVFAQGTDGGMWQKWYDTSVGWQAWSRLEGGILESAPSVASWAAGRLDIFSTTSGGELQHHWYGNGTWGSWDNLGKPSPSISLTSAPGAISWGEGRIDVFARGSDGELWQKWYDTAAGGWQPWGKIGGVLNSAPTLASWGAGRLDLFSTGPAGDLQHQWFDATSGGWKQWESLGKTSNGRSLTSGPGAISWGEGRLDVFGRGSDGMLWQKWYSGNHGGWKPWVRFTGVINSVPTISSWAPGRLDEFSVGPAGDLQHYWFGTNGWGSWESFGYPLN